MRQGIASVWLVTASGDSTPYVHDEWVPRGLGGPSRARMSTWLSHGFSPGGSEAFACRAVSRAVATGPMFGIPVL